MKRFAISLAATIMTLLTIMFVGTSKFASDNKANNKHAEHHHTQNAQSKKEIPEPRVNGQINPDLIPDFAAYEILFRLLSTTDPEEEKIELRKAAYLREAGFDSAEAAAIFNAAYEYKRQIEPLDAQVDDIKNNHWPQPSQEVMEQLTVLQQKKESVISNITRGLQNQLDSYDPIKLKKHIDDNVKRQTNGFSTALPTKKISILRQFISEAFTTAAAQAPGCDALVYLYNNVTIDWSNYVVYGSGSYSLPYNNCGHTVNLSTELWGGGYYQTGLSGTYINLEDYADHFLDGYFMSTTTGEGYCPVANQTFPAGNMTGDKVVPKYVRLYPFGSWSPTSIHKTGGTPPTTSYIGLKITASQTSNCTVTLEPSYEITAGNTPVAIAAPVVGGSSFSITGGTSTTKTISYWATAITSNPTRIKAELEASATNSVTIRYPNPVGTSVKSVGELTITP